MIKLDYTIESPSERNELVTKILEENPDINEKYLENLADYLVLCMEKQEKKEKAIITENRKVTVNKREVSFEGLVSKFENGEDGIYNLINDSKTIIFKPQVKITKKDIQEIPYLRQLLEAIADWEKISKSREGKEAYIIKKALIEMRKEQYIIKNAYRKPIVANNIIKTKPNLILDDSYTFDEDGFVKPSGASLCDYNICSIILCNYSKLKEAGWGNLRDDLWCLLEDFDSISSYALKDYPLYQKIVTYKIDGLQNLEIQQKIEEEFGIKHSLEYISSLWRKKIPKMIASAAEDEILNWHYLTKEKGTYKRCSRCGEVKLAHNKYFSKNKTSKDGFYSICKKCRNKKEV